MIVLTVRFLIHLNTDYRHSIATTRTLYRESIGWICFSGRVSIAGERLCLILLAVLHALP